MPLGMLAICLGWYGVAHSHYVYDQNTYLISGGLLGLGLVFLGGFLYFGAWLARMSAEQRDNSRAIADAMSVLADALGNGRRLGGEQTSNGTSMAAAAAAAAAAAVHCGVGPACAGSAGRWRRRPSPHRSRRRMRQPVWRAASSVAGPADRR